MARSQGIYITGIRDFEARSALQIPLVSSRISAGFPSPADDFIDGTLDLNEFLVRHPAATFFVRVAGESMIESGIHPGDILIVDRALEPVDGNVVIAVVDGEFTVKRLSHTDGRCFLIAENPAYPPLEIEGAMNLEIWGVVTSVIHKV